MVKKLTTSFLVFLLFLVSAVVLAKPALAEELTENVNYTLVGYEDVEESQFTGVIGSLVTIDLDTLKDEFLFYIHNGKVITEIETQFVVSKSNNIIVVIENEEEHVTVFLDSNGALLQAGFEEGFEFTEQDPTKPGLNFVGFNNHKDTDRVKVATYELQDNDAVVITVEGGTSSPEDVKQGQVVTLEPTNSEEFTYWADEDGQVVSTNPNYRFTAAFDLTLNAVYDLEYVPAPNVYLTNVSGIREGYKSFLGYVEEVEGFTLVEYGVLAHDEAEVLTIDTPFVEVIPSTSLTANSEFLRTIDDELGMLVSFRGYAIFDNGTELVTVYSDNNFAIVSTVTGESHEQIFKFTTGQSSYATRTVMGVQGKNWVATDARTDQLIGEDGNRTITIKSGSLNTQFINGLSSLEFDYQKKYSDNDAYIEIYINEDLVGERIVIENNTSPVHKYINEELMYEGEVNIEIKVNGRVAINNIIWKDYSKEELDTKLLEVEFVLDESSKETLIYGKVVEEPVEPSKVGFVFDGWFIDGTNEMYDFNTPVTRHLKLVARFSPLEEFTVSFDLNGGIGNIDNQVVFEGEAALEPADKPTHETLVFAGWTTTKDSEDYYDFETLIFDNITLYAKWVDELEDTEIYASDLFISMYVEGAPGNRKAIQIFNGTGVAVILTNNYTIRVGSNGGNWGAPINLTGSLEHDDVYVIRQSIDGGWNANLTANLNFNGDDAIGLFKNEELIDVFGVYGQDPGTGWSLSSTGNGSDTVDKVVQRKVNVFNPNIIWERSEWEVVLAIPNANTDTQVGILLSKYNWNPES